MRRNETISSGIFVLIIGILFACIFFGGCISRNDTHNQGTIRPTPVISANGVCPPVNKTPYIIINPISTHSVGDIFEINGTTNLGGDDRLRIAITEERPTAVGPYDNPEVYRTFTDTLGYVTMNQEACGIHSWSYQVNLTGFHSLAVYDVKVYLEQNRSIINYANFFIRRDD